jgi:hypothetical protein
MAKKKKAHRQVAVQASKQDEFNSLSTPPPLEMEGDTPASAGASRKDFSKAVSLRIPAGLADKARSHADTIGVSLNALLLVALSEYLRERRHP